MVASLALASRWGILIKNTRFLEVLSEVRTMVLDKTGTVTTGRMTLIEVHVGEDTERSDVLRLAGALEAASEHPIARAVALGAVEELGALPTPTTFDNLGGRGVVGTVDGRDVFINGLHVGRAKTHTFDRRPLDPIAPTVIPPGHVYVQGSSADSFDSRYRSSVLVSTADVVARVRPLL